jgi:hypothetical protein
MNTVTTEAGRQAMKALRSLELTRNNVSTEAGRKEATESIRKENRLQLSMLQTAKTEMWELWGKTNSQIGRDCILTGIVEASKEIEKIEKIIE